MKGLLPRLACIPLTVLAALGAAPSVDAATPLATASPETLHFKTSALDHTDTQTVILTNRSPKTAALVLVPMRPESPFAVTDSSCSAPLSRGESCRVTVRFTATHWGLATGKLEFAYQGNPLITYVVHLRGIARLGSDE